MYKFNYYTNKEKGIVVCKITDVQCSVCEEMEKKQLNFPHSLVCGLLQTIPDEYVGKARCSGDDKFDEKTGRAIAYKRAVEKANRSKKKVMQRFIEEYTRDYNDTVARMNALAERYKKAEENAVEGLANLMAIINQ